MKSGRAPDYCLISPVNELPAGAFVRPIELKWVAECTKERLNITAWGFNEETQVVCYTRLGMMILARSNIREL